MLSLGQLDFVDRLRIAAEKKPTVLPRWVFDSLKTQLACASVELESVAQTQVELSSISADTVAGCAAQC